MAATDWRDIIRRGGAAPAAPQPAFDAVPAAPAAPPSSPEIERLLAERVALEGRMAALTGNNARDAARYPVAPMAERRADHRRWEDDRATRAAAFAARRPAAPADPGRRAPPARIDPAPEPRSAATPVDPRRWYAQRDAEIAAKPAEKSVAKRPVSPPQPAPLTSTRPQKPAAPRPRTTAEPLRRPAAINPVKPVTRVKSVVKPVASPARRKPADPLITRDAQRDAARDTQRDAAAKARAAATPAPKPRPEPARPLTTDLRRALTTALDRAPARKIPEKIGADRIAKPKEKIQQPLARARDALDSANRAVRSLSDAWDKRRDRIAGPDLTRYTQGYDERKARLLGVDTGSLGDLAKRTESQRQAGIARRAEARRAETADENRRTRATEKRKANRDQT